MLQVVSDDWRSLFDISRDRLIYSELCISLIDQSNPLRYSNLFCLPVNQRRRGEGSKRSSKKYISEGVVSND